MDSLNPLPAWQRRGLYATLALLTFSGLAWLALHYGAGAGHGELPHPLEGWLMRLHGAAGFAALFVAGLLAAGHVPRGWRMSRGRVRRPSGAALPRRSGSALCALGAALAASGYLLYYFAPENLRPALGLVHTVLGVALAALLPAHAGWRSAARDAADIADMPLG